MSDLGIFGKSNLLEIATFDRKQKWNASSHSGQWTNPGRGRRFNLIILLRSNWITIAFQKCISFQFHRVVFGMLNDIRFADVYMKIIKSQSNRLFHYSRTCSICVFIASCTFNEHDNCLWIANAYKLIIRFKKQWKKNTHFGKECFHLCAKLLK